MPIHRLLVTVLVLLLCLPVSAADAGGTSTATEGRIERVLSLVPRVLVKGEP